MTTTATPPADFGQPVSELYRDPAGYQASPALVTAVEVAQLLGMPLLLTGEPGCGKTSVAGWIAWRLGLPEPLEYNVKSTSSGRDLLYEFDELARFRDAQARQADTDLLRYLHLNALGLAIALAGEPDERMAGRTNEADTETETQADTETAADSPASPQRAGRQRTHTRAELVAAATGQDLQRRFGQRHVVLIDELDKAPRDTPNDLLNEILNMRFELRELDVKLQGDPTLRPLVVITSNSEKSLPEPFLRRCVFHHIETPDAKTRLEIIERRRHPFAQRGDAFNAAMRLFDHLCQELGRAPGTAELLAWLTTLEARAQRDPSGGLHAWATGTLGTLAKTKEDLARAEEGLNQLVA